MYQIAVCLGKCHKGVQNMNFLLVIGCKPLDCAPARRFVGRFVEIGEHFLLLHNEEDLKGMLEIAAALAIPDLFRLPVTVTRVQANYYKMIYVN